MAEFLLELLAEEMPARMQQRAADDLQRMFTERLTAAELAFAGLETFVTPRRLALVVNDLPLAQQDQRVERRGPREDAPDRAIDGFLRSVGLARTDCEVREEAKGRFLWAVVDNKGRPTQDVLPEIIVDVVSSFRWPKSMRDGHGNHRWVRPLRSVLAVFDGAVLSGEVFGRRFAGSTTGHRFLAPEAFEVADFDQYDKGLRDRFVMLRAAERQQTIVENATDAVARSGLRLKSDPALVEEIAGLVEWPVVYTGAIDDDFMDVPPEILTTAMRTHQKYLAATRADGSLAPIFVFAANVSSDDGGKAIIDGNQRVLRARLSDAKFFWDQDRRTTLESRAGALDGIVFHARLGSVGDKARRIAGLAATMCTYIVDSDATKARRAGGLAKADLVSGLVGEFPELQGLMGRYFALEDGEDAAVALAIGEHYAPLGPSDDVPNAPTSVAVALADKLDTLAGFWLIDEKPTGSKDPFALRRAALGVIRIIIDNDLRVPLLEAFDHAAEGFDGRHERIGGDLMAFFVDRMKVHLREQDVPHDHVTAVFGAGGDDDLVRMLARVRALGVFLSSEDGGNLLTAYRRAANIVRAEEKNDKTVFDGKAYDGSLAECAESDLWQNLSRTEGVITGALEAEAYGDAMAALATLREPVDRFFDGVTVNDDDGAVRVNRLRLLGRIVMTMDGVADFSAIGG